MGGVLEARWCILKHVLLAARYLEELFERLAAERSGLADAVEPCYRALHGAAEELFSEVTGVGDRYAAYHLMHALMEVLAAEVHAAEAEPEALPALRSARRAVLDAVRAVGRGAERAHGGAEEGGRGA